MIKKDINILTPSSHVDDVLFDMTWFAWNEDVPEHSHDCIEIVTIVEGNGIHCFNGEYSKCLHGNVFIVLPGNTHAFVKNHNLGMYNISCTTDVLRSFGLDTSFWHACQIAFKGGKHNISLNFTGRKLADARALLKTMYGEYLTEHQERQLRLRSLFSLFFMMLAQEFSEAAASPDSGASIVGTATFIERHYREHLTLDQLAQQSCLSKSQLIRRFQAEFRTTPIAYLLDFRLQQAGKMLLETSLRVEEIALATGFRDCNYFIKQFKKRYNVSPGRFRK